MPANIEIKAHVRDAASLQAAAEALSHTPGTVLHQEDTFFVTARGRLKLRMHSPDTGELIYYERQDTPDATLSQYTLVSIQAPLALKAALSAALGVRGVVRKQRRLYMLGQTRLHLDDVEGLGTFVEIECVLRPEQSPQAGRQIVATLMRDLGITPEDLIAEAYVDLFPKRSAMEQS